MLPLTDARWQDLRQAYGPAGNIPALLRRARTDHLPGDRAGGAWFELWSTLCHQGDAYTASYAAVPHLISIAEEWGSRGGYDPLLLAASIEQARLEGTAPAVPTELADAYAAAVREGAALAEAALREASDDVSRRAFAGSVAALTGDRQGARTVFDADLEEDD